MGVHTGLMSSSTIELNFADGEYTFALPLVQINELQRKCGIGIGGLYGRVTKGVQVIDSKAVLIPGLAEFYALDLIETIRHALIGGGKGVVNGEAVVVAPTDANRLIETYVLGQPMQTAWDIAATVLSVCLMGYDPPKKEPPASERANPKPRAKKAASTTP